MELLLAVLTNSDGSFKVYRKISLPVELTNSVITVDYNYTPWPRYNGNLLWP